MQARAIDRTTTAGHTDTKSDTENAATSRYSGARNPDYCKSLLVDAPVRSATSSGQAARHVPRA